MTCTPSAGRGLSARPAAAGSSGQSGSAAGAGAAAGPAPAATSASSLQFPAPDGQAPAQFAHRRGRIRGPGSAGRRCARGCAADRPGSRAGCCHSRRDTSRIGLMPRLVHHVAGAGSTLHQAPPLVGRDGVLGRQGWRSSRCRSPARPRPRRGRRAAAGAPPGAPRPAAACPPAARSRPGSPLPPARPAPRPRPGRRGPPGRGGPGRPGRGGRPRPRARRASASSSWAMASFSSWSMRCSRAAISSLTARCWRRSLMPTRRPRRSARRASRSRSSRSRRRQAVSASSRSRVGQAGVVGQLDQQFLPVAGLLARPVGGGVRPRSAPARACPVPPGCR